MLSVGLLGGFRVAAIDARIWRDLGPGARGLASFLFTYPDRSHRREKLAELFWPGLDTEREHGDDIVVFDPLRVTDGIEPSDDPVLHFRSLAYSASVKLRTGVDRGAEAPPA